MWRYSSSFCRVPTIDFPIFFSSSIVPSRDCLRHWLRQCVFGHVLLFDYRSFCILVKIQTLVPSDRRSNCHKDSVTQSNMQIAVGVQPCVSTSGGSPHKRCHAHQKRKYWRSKLTGVFSLFCCNYQLEIQPHDHLQLEWIGSVLYFWCDESFRFHLTEWFFVYGRSRVQILAKTQLRKAHPSLLWNHAE